MSAPLSIAFLVDSVPITRAVIAGETSLGGSESACLGLARALKARGHDVRIFATKMDESAQGTDDAGVIWQRMESFLVENQFIEWDVVVSLRMFHWFQQHIHARLKLLWNQDLLLPGVGPQVMSIAWNLDKIVYVSEYHRQQWEDQQAELAPLGWVTKNGYEPAFVPTDNQRDPNRIIHISRPERGLAPLLAMWPALKARVPEATLQICRYSSMYDAGGWGKVCASYDEQIAAVNEAVGGITYLGELNKPQLMKAISEAAVMWYPGVASFAETSCIASIESQACGTPFVGSLKGALVETARPSFDAGLLIEGDAERDAAYQTASVDAVVKLLDGCKRNTVAYRQLQKASRDYAQDYTYEVVADEWECQINEWFDRRYRHNYAGVMRALLHEDDHATARVVAREVLALRDLACELNQVDDVRADVIDAFRDAEPTLAFCDRVIDGKEQGPEDYSAHAFQDPLAEAEQAGRFKAISPMFDGCTRVLDAACGNGAGAIRLALDHPELHIVGVDYSIGNIESARRAVEKVGIADRCKFIQGTIYDFDTQKPLALELPEGKFDGLFVGEFIEHVADCTALVDGLEAYLSDGAKVVYTCPYGPFGELLPMGMPYHRGHVHSFRQDDVTAVFGEKQDFAADFFSIGVTPRGVPIGHWFIHYTKQDGLVAGQRDYATRALRTRPMQRLSVGLIVKDVEDDLSRCLRSVWNIADEIIVGDTGSSDGTKAIAEKFGAKVIDLAPLQQQPQGFAGARNAVLKAASSEWFLWIDADEQLIDPHLLRRHIEGQVFNGFVIRQHHLQLDMGPSFDVPIRLFRRTPEIEFYGCIHEQPQMGDANGDITPALELGDVKIAHTGYLTEDVRRGKMLERNLPLLHLDQQAFPDRTLGKVLVLRDCVNLADYECESKGGMTQRAQRGYADAVRRFIADFDDPNHKYHAIARPWYEVALRRLNVGWECEWAFAGKEGGLGTSKAKPNRIWVRSAEELERLIAKQIQDATKKMASVPLKTDPFVLPARVAA